MFVEIAPRVSARIDTHLHSDFHLVECSLSGRTSGPGAENRDVVVAVGEDVSVNEEEGSASALLCPRCTEADK